MITVSINDGITPTIANYLKNNPQMLRSLSKSVGWYVQKNIKALVKNNTQLTSQWPERSPYAKVRRKLDYMAPKIWMGRLKRAIGYSYSYNEGSVNIGWTSSTGAKYGRIQEYGEERQVTPSMAGYFARAGVPLSPNKKFIRVPARPLFEPAMDIINPQIGDFVQSRVSEYMKNGGFARKEGKSRRYRVWG